MTGIKAGMTCAMLVDTEHLGATDEVNYDLSLKAVVNHETTKKRLRR